MQFTKYLKICKRNHEEIHMMKMLETTFVKKLRLFDSPQIAYLVPK